MASSLLSNVNSEAQKQANILTNTPRLVKVIVEDELDVVVWHSILKRSAPGLDFEVTPYSYDSYNNGKGKSNVLKFSDRYHENFIGCVDSDFDWLLQNWTEDGRLVNENAYVLQTYAYSIENLASQPYEVSDCMLECVLHSCELQRRLDEDYSEFLNAISLSVYETLVWHLVMWKNKIDEDTLAYGWQYIFGYDHYKDLVNDNTLSLDGSRKAVLQRFQERNGHLTTHYNQEYHDFAEVRDRLRKHLLENFNLSVGNAYLFVRGHNLYDFLMQTFFNPVRNELIKIHKDTIKAHSERKDIQNRMNHYTNNIKDFRREHLYNTEYMDDVSNFISKAIIADVEKIFHITRKGTLSGVI